MYVGSYDGYLYALDAASGAVLWRAPTGGEVRSSATPSADGARVFVGSSDGYLYAFDAASGALAWRAFCGESDPLYGVRSTPALSADEARVFVGSADGCAYCFESGVSAPERAVTS